MYVIERGTSAWLCNTVIEAFEVDSVRLRLRGDVKDFAEFQRRLDNFENIEAGVIQVSKCSDASKCQDCEILRTVQETAKAHTEWVKLVQSNGGYTF